MNTSLCRRLFKNISLHDTILQYYWTFLFLLEAFILLFSHEVRKVNTSCMGRTVSKQHSLHVFRRDAAALSIFFFLRHVSCRIAMAITNTFYLLLFKAANFAGLEGRNSAALSFFFLRRFSCHTRQG